MKVLFVTLCALETNTSVTKSNIGLLEGLKDNNCDVTIVMPEIDSGLFYYDNAFDLSPFKVVRIKGGGLGSKAASMNQSTSVIKKALLNLARNIYRRVSIFDRTKEFLGNAKDVPVFEEYYDVVISTSDPKTSHLFVKKLIEEGLKYGKWVQHWGDPLSGDITSSLIFPQSYIRKVEKNMISKADKIVYVSPFTAEMQKNNYPKFKEKIHFVPLACDKTYEGNAQILNNAKPIEAVYLGDYSSRVRNIIPLYEAVKNLPTIHLTIAGGTDLSLESSDNITILPRVNHEKVKELESNASIIISIGNLHGTQIPGKLYYAASTNKPIVVTVDGDNKDEMIKYLNSFNRFDVCLNEMSSIENLLDRIAKEPRKEYRTPDRLRPVNVMSKILG